MDETNHSYSRNDDEGQFGLQGGSQGWDGRYREESQRQTGSSAFNNRVSSQGDGRMESGYQVGFHQPGYQRYEDHRAHNHYDTPVRSVERPSHALPTSGLRFEFHDAARPLLPLALCQLPALLPPPSPHSEYEPVVPRQTPQTQPSRSTEVVAPGPAPQAKEPVPTAQQVKKKKGKAKADVAEKDAQTASKSGKAGKGGRLEKSTNYSAADHVKLLNLLIADPPQGQNGWVRITNAFNSWAKAENRPMRTDGSLKDKYHRLVREASAKPPAGEANRLAYHLLALEAVQAIDDKAGTKAYGLEEDGDDSEVEIIEETGEMKAEGAKVKVEKTASVKGPKVTKAFKVSFDTGEASPLTNKPPRRNNQLNSATNAFGQMSEYFSPAAAQEREANKLASALQLQQYGSLEWSVQRLEDQNFKLQEQLQTKTMEFQQKLLEAES